MQKPTAERESRGVERIQPDFLIIDSIQTIMSPDFEVAGIVSQVREVTAELMQLAQNQ